MNCRTAVLLAFFLLITINTALVVSDTPTCPEDGATSKHVPGSGLCPKPDDKDCSLNSYDWDYAGTAWIIWSQSAWDEFNQAPFGGNYYRDSYAGEWYWGFFEPYAWIESFEVDLIATTNAVCDGMRYYNRRNGDFREDYTGNDDDFIMEDSKKEPCYDFDKCVWKNSGTISGWRTRTVGAGQDAYVEYYYSIQPRRICSTNDDPSTNNRAPYVVCEKDDGGA
jgi:hypothetical protein